MSSKENRIQKRICRANLSRIHCMQRSLQWMWPTKGPNSQQQIANCRAGKLNKRGVCGCGGSETPPGHPRYRFEGNEEKYGGVSEFQQDNDVEVSLALPRGSDGGPCLFAVRGSAWDGRIGAQTCKAHALELCLSRDLLLPCHLV